MIDESKSGAVISKILRETTETIIQWSLSNHRVNGMDGDEELIGNIYQADISGKHIRLYKYKFKWYVEEDVYHWVSRIRLEFFSSYNGATEWTFPYSNTLDDLYDAVMAQTAGVNDFFDEYLD